MADAIAAPAIAEGLTSHTQNQDVREEFETAVRPAEKARVMLAGPSGSGRTFTALAVGTGMLPEGGKLGVIDSERGRAAFYADRFAFRHMRLHSFEPQALIRALAVAADAGIDVLAVDGASPFWSGRGGALAQVDAAASGRGRGDSGSRWRDVNPVLWDLSDALLAYPGHLIVTVRVRTEWVVAEVEPGKAAPLKLGTKLDQRDGLDYDFDLVGNLDQDHTLTVDSSRYPAVPVGSRHELPGADFGKTVVEWLAGGADTGPGVMDFAAAAIDPAQTPQELRTLLTDAERSGLLGAAVLDLDRKATSLGSLIKLMGFAARVRESVTTTEALRELTARLGQGDRLRSLVPGRDGQLIPIGELIRQVMAERGRPGSAAARAMDAATNHHATEGSAA